MGGVPNRRAQETGQRDGSDGQSDLERQFQQAAEMTHPQRPMTQLQFMREFFGLKRDKSSLVVDECFLLLQESIRLRLARASQRQGDSNRIDATGYRLSASILPFGFLRHPAPTANSQGY